MSIAQRWRAANPSVTSAKDGMISLAAFADAEMAALKKDFKDRLTHLYGYLKADKAMMEEMEKIDYKGIQFEPPTSAELALLDPVQAAKRLGVRP